MNDAFYVAATGMQGQQINVNTIANNITNVNTNGFKSARVNFSELVTNGRGGIPVTAAAVEAGVFAAPTHLGAGLGVASVSQLFEQGELKKTGSATDIAITGNGFLEVVMADGSSAFTRGGSLIVNVDGVLATQSGMALKQQIAVPEGTQRISILSDGRVQFLRSGQDVPLDGGQLELVHFRNATALTSLGGGVFSANENTGSPIAGSPGQDGLGYFAQGYLEGSNVKLVDEMVNLMIAQRAYEASVKVVQSADEMLAMTNSLRK